MSVKYLFCCLRMTRAYEHQPRWSIDSSEVDVKSHYYSTDIITSGPRIINHATYVKRKKKSNSLNDLNDKCLTNILSYIPIEARVRLSVVSRRWRELTKQSLMTTTHLTLINRQLTRSGLFEWMPILTSLQLINCTINEEVQQSLIKHQRLIERLELNTIKLVDTNISYDEFLKQFFMNNPHVRHFTINCITENDLIQSVPFLSNLQSLRINFEPPESEISIDYNGKSEVKAFLGNLFTKLNCPIKSISAANVNILHPVGLIKNSIVRCSLVELSLINSPINYGHFKMLVKGLINLEVFNCELINEPISEKTKLSRFASIKQQLNLQELRIQIKHEELNNCYSNDFSINSGNYNNFINEIMVHNYHPIIGTIKNCSQLRVFELIGAQLTNESLRKLSKLTKLTAIKLISINSSKQIRINHEINDQGVNYLSELNNLTDLVLTGTRCTEASLINLVRRNPNLINLVISGSELVSYRNLLEKLIEVRNGRQLKLICKGVDCDFANLNQINAQLNIPRNMIILNGRMLKVNDNYMISVDSKFFENCNYVIKKLNQNSKLRSRLVTNL